MGDFRLSDANVGQFSAGVAASSVQQPVTSGAVDTKGSWTVLVADVGEPITEILLYMGELISVSAAATGLLLDVGIAPVGAGAGTETVLVADLLFSMQAGHACVRLPIMVPRGYRISVRTASSTASKVTRWGITTISGGMYGQDGAQAATTLGAVTTGSTGFVMTAPGSTNTKAAWSVLSASTARFARWLTLCLGGPATTAATAALSLVDIGYGGAGAEAVLLGDIPFDLNSSEQARSAPITVPCNIPAGSRLVARYQATSTATAARPTLTAVLYS